MAVSQPLQHISWREKIGRGVLGCLVGAVSGLLGGPIMGGICGFIYTVAILNFSSMGTGVMPSNAGPIYLLPFLVAFILFQVGSIIGGLMGLFTAFSHSRIAQVVVAITLTAGCGGILSQVTSKTREGFVLYAVPCFATMLLCINRVEESLRPKKKILS